MKIIKCINQLDNSENFVFVAGMVSEQKDEVAEEARGGNGNGEEATGGGRGCRS